MVDDIFRLNPQSVFFWVGKEKHQSGIS